MLYALAAAGGVIGYVPLLTLLLPIKLALFAGADRYRILAFCGVAGAAAAAVANVAFGWLGDRSVARGRGRRGWLAGGVAATIASFAGVALAHRVAGIVVAVMLFQVAVNAVLAQIGGLIAEEIPAAQKGAAAALLTLGAPVAAAVSAFVVAVAAGEGARLALVAALMTACILPLMLVRPPRLVAAAPLLAAPIAMRRDLAVAWAARLLVQIAGCGVGLFLLFYFEDIAGAPGDTTAVVARLLVVAGIVPVPVAVLLGRWSDRTGRREPVLAAAAILATLGLLGMAAARSWAVGAVSYVGFAGGVAIFLALNTGHAMLLLPTRTHHGRDLGILNLANTIPQIVGPLLAWWWAAAHDFAAALAAMALLTLTAAILPWLVGAATRVAGRGTG